MADPTAGPSGVFGHFVLQRPTARKRPAKLTVATEPRQTTPKMIVAIYGRRYPRTFWKFWDQWHTAENEEQRHLLIEKYQDKIEQYDTWMCDTVELVHQYHNWQARLYHEG